jgi:hypothetical protein
MEAYERPERFNFWQWINAYRIPLVLIGVLVVAIIIGLAFHRPEVMLDSL